MNIKEIYEENNRIYEENNSSDQKFDNLEEFAPPSERGQDDTSEEIAETELEKVMSGNYDDYSNASIEDYGL